MERVAGGRRGDLIGAAAAIRPLDRIAPLARPAAAAGRLPPPGVVYVNSDVFIRERPMNARVLQCGYVAKFFPETVGRSVHLYVLSDW